jgi:hypothetical protein
MAKAQTDIRTTSYDTLAARPFGYQGTIDDVIAKIRAESAQQSQMPTSRVELLNYLGVSRLNPRGPSVEMDTDVRYGDEPKQQLDVSDPGFFGFTHAKYRGWV